MLFPFLVFLLVEELTTGKKREEEDEVFRTSVVHLPLTITFLLVDVIMTIILLIGAHKVSCMFLKKQLHAFSHLAV